MGFTAMPNEDKELRRATDQTPQMRFEAAYITAAEIYRSHEIARPTLLGARRRGLLPGGINVGGGIYIWERTPELMKTLEAWRLMLAVRRNGTTNT